MGLSHSVGSKFVERAGNGRMRVASVCMNGKRDSMEDAHAFTLSLPKRKNTVYDGHTGSAAAEYCKKHLHEELDKLKSLSPVSIEKCFLELDKKFLETKDRSGCAVAFAFVTTRKVGNKKHYSVKLGNVGDSRVLVIDGATGELKAVTVDHKPSNPQEYERIKAASLSHVLVISVNIRSIQEGSVSSDRVDGQLALSRAIGDLKYKSDESLSAVEQKVIAVPSITTCEANEGDMILVCCDGIIEPKICTNEHIAEFIRWQVNKHPTHISKALINLTRYCSYRGSNDNMSAILVHLRNGRGYSGSRYMAGKLLPEWLKDRSFMDAYIRFAKNCGVDEQTMYDLAKKKTIKLLKQEKSKIAKNIVKRKLKYQLDSTSLIQQKQHTLINLAEWNTAAMDPKKWIGDPAQFHCAKQVVGDELVITTIAAPRHKLDIARPVIIPKWNESQKRSLFILFDGDKEVADVVAKLLPKMLNANAEPLGSDIDDAFQKCAEQLPSEFPKNSNRWDYNYTSVAFAMVERGKETSEFQIVAGNLGIGHGFLFRKSPLKFIPLSSPHRDEEIRSPSQAFYSHEFSWGPEKVTPHVTITTGKPGDCILLATDSTIHEYRRYDREYDGQGQSYVPEFIRNMWRDLSHDDYLLALENFITNVRTDPRHYAMHHIAMLISLVPPNTPSSSTKFYTGPVAKVINDAAWQQCITQFARDEGVQLDEAMIRAGYDEDLKNLKQIFDNDIAALERAQQKAVEDTWILSVLGYKLHSPKNE